MEDENSFQIEPTEFGIINEKFEFINKQFYMDIKLYPFLFKNAVYVVSKIGNIYNLSNQGNFRKKDK